MLLVNNPPPPGVPVTHRPSRSVAALLALLVTLSLAAVLAGSGSGPVATAPVARPVAARPAAVVATRPNILVIETDDMRWDDLRWMPSVRRLVADRGLSFENSFAPYPLCCPSRSSFLSGQYTHNHH